MPDGPSTAMSSVRSLRLAPGCWRAKIHTFGAFPEMGREAEIGIGVYDGVLVALRFYNMLLWLSLKRAAL